ncbi:protein-export membrane protein SecD [Boudabousia liubingyangii]|uniref:protein translocase subunit SecD n=1 Tax=Boudabousia liubingyangii TaxID=1921764 RepID=UPI00093D3570|nr:protein translocase subunit SecD [Boudabousia liubingyangii]OKL47719.1 protein-export membrane protein SecD [Boudabousia liubingyangii]
MADTRIKKARRPLIVFLTILVIAAITLGVGSYLGKASWKPKLALDLEGGTQLVLTPTATEGKVAKDGRTEVTNEDLNQAIDIIRQRVDASGVSEAEITSQGGQNIVVSLPGKPSEETLNLVRKSAVMVFRSVLRDSHQVAAVSPKAFEEQAKQLAVTPEGPQKPEETAQRLAALKQAEELSKLSPEEIATRLADENHDGKISDTPASAPKDNSDPAWITEKTLYDFYLLDCSDPTKLNDNRIEPDDKAIAACGSEGHSKYILSPVDIQGSEIKNATAGLEHSGPNGATTGQWEVVLEFNSKGTDQFTQVSQRLFNLKATDPVRSRFAIMLDGVVISAPSMNAVISGGSAQITGNFNSKSATALANQLKFGSLPLTFKVESEQQISATLGSDHLQKGLWAGLIGLLLVIVYLAWSYHGLALVALGSLLMAAISTYLAVVLLGWQMGYRLSLPGVTGLIISIGITADSFIVYFERIRDEVRDGANLVNAVETGWEHAKKTILISDAVNILAAVILYVLAVGGVQGFAFTLGLTTLIDLAVIFMFTHPILVMLLKVPFFGEGRKWSGFDAETLGATPTIYAGRGRVRAPHERRSIADRRAERKNEAESANEEEAN